MAVAAGGFQEVLKEFFREFHQDFSGCCYKEFLYAVSIRSSVWSVYGIKCEFESGIVYVNIVQVQEVFVYVV